MIDTYKNTNIKTFNPAGALFIYLCHLAVALFFYFRGEMWNLEPYYWSALFVFVASIPYIGAFLTKKFIFYEPKYLFLGVFLLSHTVFLFLGPDAVLDLEAWSYTEWTQVVKVLILGTIAFLVGYQFILGKVIAERMPLRNFVIPENLLFKLPPRLYFLGWTLRILPMIFRRFGPEFSFIVNAIQRLQGWQITNIVMTSTIYAALMIDAFLCFSNPDPELRNLRRKKYFYRLSFFFAIELFYAFTATGMKENILIPILLIFIAYFRTKKRIPYLVLIFATVFFVGIVMPFMSVYRKARARDGKFESSLVDTVDRIYIERDTEDIWINVVRRLSAPLELSVVSATLRKEGIEVRTYANIFDYLSRFIPRFLWPDKPVIDYNRIGREIGILHDEDYNTSICLTLVGSLIMNYGFYGVIAGMFLVGLIHRTYWEWLVVRTGNNLFSFIVYFLALYTWIRIDEFAICLHSNLGFFIYLYFMLKLVKERR